MRSASPLGIGVDIAPDAVRVAAISVGAHAPTLLGFATQPLPTDAIVGGRPVRGMAVSRAIEAAVDTLRQPPQAITLSAFGERTIVTLLELPMMEDAELAENIEWEADNAIPMDMAEMALEYRVVGRAEAKSTMTVCLSGLPRTQLDALVVVGRKSKSEVRAVETVAEGLRRGHTLAGVRVDAKPAAIVELAGGRVTVVVSVWGETVFVREATAVGDDAVGAIERTLDSCEATGEKIAEVVVAGVDAVAVAGALGGLARPWTPAEIVERADGVGVPEPEFAAALGLAMPAPASNVIGEAPPKKGWFARLFGG